MDLNTILIIAGVIVAVIAFLFFLVPYLVKKNILTSRNIEFVKRLIETSESALVNLVPDNKFKKDAQLIIDLIEKVVRHVEQTMKYDDPENKKKEAVGLANEIIGSMGINRNDTMDKLIDVTIEAAVSTLPKTNK